MAAITRQEPKEGIYITRKDYIAIAESIARQRQQALTEDIASFRTTRLGVLAEIALDMADIMAKDNTRFDRERFLKACTVTK